MAPTTRSSAVAVAAAATATAALEVYVLSFNCARNLINPLRLSPHLLSALPSPTSPLPDLLAVSLQEVAPLAPSFLGGARLVPYLARVDEAVLLAAEAHERRRAAVNGDGGDDDGDGGGADDGGGGPPPYERIFARCIGMTALLVFARPNVAARVVRVCGAGVGAGLWAMGNKGAVGARVEVRSAAGGGRNGETGQEEEEAEEEEGAAGLAVITFVAAHLAPMEANWERRNRDWERIVRNLVFADLDDEDGDDNKDRGGRGMAEPSGRKTPDNDEQRPLLSPGSDTISSSSAATTRPSTPSGLYSPPHAPVFFAGDLNYRTSDTPPNAASQLTYPSPSATPRDDLKNWLARDQLAREMRSGNTLHGFGEAEVGFGPTYKLAVAPQPPQESAESGSGGDTPGREDAGDEDEHEHGNGEEAEEGQEQEGEGEWRFAPHRFPSWCDRILFLSPASPSSRSAPRAHIRTHAYTSLPPLLTSDHRPVALSATLTLPPAPTSTSPARPAPFPLNPAWRADRAAARRREVLVGYLAAAATAWEKRRWAVAAAAAALCVGVWGMWWWWGADADASNGALFWVFSS